MSARLGVLRRAAVVLAFLMAAVLVITVTVTLVVIRRPLPTIAGTMSVTGLEQEVSVQRDALGVPQIYASSDHDLFFAQGFVDAQDRFFEMDYRRHVTAGRLSELVGDVESARNADTVIRTLGWRHVAEQEFDLLTPETQAYLTAYADGVNAYIEDREASQLGLEYTVLGVQVPLADIEPWTPVDSLAWLKAMAWDLRSNYDDELGRAQAYRALGSVSLVGDLFPPYPYAVNAPIIPGEDSPTAQSDPSGAVVDASYDDALDGGEGAIADAAAALDAVPVLLGRGAGVGSNSFVVSGEHTESGLPILANDPHLTTGAPSVWHQVGLHCVEQSDSCTFDVAGFSFAGLPGVVIGHNADLAWGLTNMGADVTDFYLERTYPDGTYARDGERLAVEEREEVIDVAGGDSFTITVRSTVHGPIISDAIGAVTAASSTPVPAGSPAGGLDGYAISLGWTALTPGTTMDAMFALNRAATAEDVAAAAATFEVPAQNIVFATTAGDIGYQAPGRIPVRSGAEVVEGIPANGAWPMPGWDSAFDWQGYVSPEAMPHVLNPEEGFIVAANQAVTTPDGGPALSTDFDYGFRSQRIRSLLNGMFDSGETLTVAGAQDIMMDSSNPLAPLLVPLILRLDIHDAFVNDAVRELRQWRDDGYPNDADSAGAAYFNAVWANLVTATFSDQLPDTLAPTGGDRWIEVVSNLLEDPESSWWDDASTVTVTENRDEIITASLTQARYQLTNAMSKEPSQWRWGTLHVARFEHPVLDPAHAAGILAWLFNPTPFAVSGGNASVDATSWNVTLDDAGRFDYSMTSGPSMRMVVDLGDLDSSTWVVTTGVSGHPASRHYADQVGAWRDGDGYPWAFGTDAVNEATRDTLTLAPSS